MTDAVTLVTAIKFVADAGSQSASPGCDATTVTLPAPVNVRLMSPLIEPGPDATEKLTGKPELAVAASPTRLVVHCGPGSGKSMVCTILVIVKTLVAVPP
ncbi:MAG: hypothetical protein BWY59_00188 [Verrucomicrobia bacterium ADurb.Bin345]|nr:MAG: hypothetical protein BWY59_00188 [Verrucomicrobia bacterium ADurb.Bin345]